MYAVVYSFTTAIGRKVRRKAERGGGGILATEDA